jgi:cobalt-zinc-cadmium efflux system membrane fusion protein
LILNAQAGYIAPRRGRRTAIRSCITIRDRLELAIHDVRGRARRVWETRGTLVRAALAFVTIGCSSGATARPSAVTGAAGAANAPASDEIVVPQDAQGIATAQARLVLIPEYLAIAARVAADPTRVVRVYAPVTGRLVSVAVRPADHVERGQVLATLRSSDVAAGRATFRQARTDAQLKRHALERSRLLYENHVIALKDYQQADADAQIAHAALESAGARLALLDVDTAGVSDTLAIRAPRSGIVLDLNAAAGELSKSPDASSPICTIVDLTSVWVLGDVYEKDLASVTVGDSTEVAVGAYPGTAWRGRLTGIAGTLDTATRTLKVRVVLANPGLRLKPDMFATIRVIRRVQRGIVIPKAAVVREGAATYVFVQRSPGHFGRRAVALGSDADSDHVEVTSGLTPGEIVVAEGADLLRTAAPSS